MNHPSKLPFETILVLLLTATATAPSAATDARITLVEKQLEGDVETTLAMIDEIAEVDAERSRAWGLDYLRGHLLLAAGRRAEAVEAFATTLSATPDLAPWGRFSLAVTQAEAGDAEVAAGLVATLLGQQPPPALVSKAVALLETTILEGGDCRLLRGLERRRFSAEDRRHFDFARAECARRAGDAAGEVRRLLDLLDEDPKDDVALRAAERLAAGVDMASADSDLLRLVGLGFYEHREFELSARYLSQAIVKAPRERDLFAARFALARSYFWLRRWRAAARSYTALAAGVQEPSRRAQVLYQRGRTLELEGEERWPEASAAFQAAHAAEPSGRWSAASSMARLRLAWLRGDRDTALALIDDLRRRRKLAQLSSGLIFLASSQLVAGRVEGVDRWLAEARRLRRLPPLEIDYWSGRLAELQGDPGRAAKSYLEAAQADRFHPFAVSALARLGSESLQEPAAALAKRLARRGDLAGLHGAFLILGYENPVGHAALLELRKRLAADPRTAVFLQLAERPTEQWPIWRARLRSPEEKMLALGLFKESSNRVLRHFPVSDPGLAYTGSLALSRAGVTRRSLYIAEILAKRKPQSLPLELLPSSYRKLLYPFGYSYLILKESQKRQVDPFLLAAIIREESRFDPEAFSAASARGLTQFIVPTARAIGERIDLGPIEPADLHRPEIAVALGAGYLDQLAEHFDGHAPRIVAAYNAGEPQAELWRKYCLTDEPEEYLSKVAFRETRRYVRKVLKSRAHYADLYRQDLP